MGRFAVSTYLYSGQAVHSNIPIIELPLGNTIHGGFSFYLASVRNPSIGPNWLHHWLGPMGEILISYGRETSWHWLRFPELSDFKISMNAREIICYPYPGTSIESIRHLLLDQVLPRCFSHQGNILLHASAIRLEHELILFVGDSGSGKSTLAGNFHQAGNPVVSDDCLWVRAERDHIVAVPSYGGLRLWDDSRDALFPPEQPAYAMAHYSSKKRLPLNESIELPTGVGLNLLGMIVLPPPAQNRSSEVILERLPNREVFISMLKQTFQLDLTDLDRLKAHMQRLGYIAPRLRSFRLSMPRDYALLSVVRKKILDALLS